MEEGLAKVVGVVEDDDPPGVVCNKDDVEGLIELHHFFVGICLEVHCAGETSNVPVAGLVHHGKQVEKSCPGGVAGHDSVFLSSTSATRRAMTRGRHGNDNNDKRPSPRGLRLLEPSKTGTYVKYHYHGDAYQYALLEPSKTDTYVKYPYHRLHGSSTLVTLPA